MPMKEQNGSQKAAGNQVDLILCFVRRLALERKGRVRICSAFLLEGGGACMNSSALCLGALDELSRDF